MKALLKRTVALLIVMLMLISLISCDIKMLDKSPDESVANSEITEKPENPIDWDSLDFENKELNILVRDDINANRDWAKEDTGDNELNIAICERNDVVAKVLDLKVKFTSVPYSDHDDLCVKMSEIIEKDVNNKLYKYDIVAHHSYETSKLVLKGLYSNLLDKELFPYFDFTKVCWNQSIVNNCTINGKLYTAVGDMNISLADNAMAIWHNPDLYDEIKDDTDSKDLCELVLSQEWTYDQLYRWSSYYRKDRWGTDCDIVCGTDFRLEHGWALPRAFELDFIREREDGTHFFEYAENEKAELVMKEWIELCKQKGNGYYLEGDCACSYQRNSHFVDGKVLFKSDVLYKSAEYNAAIREMEWRYMVLPMPKYDKAQEKYHTTAKHGFNMMAVVNRPDAAAIKGEAISAYLQFANQYSYRFVRGYYYENVIHPKYFGYDYQNEHISNMVTMFDTILNGIEFDILNVYGSVLDDAEWIWSDAICSERTLGEVYADNSKEYTDALNELDKWFKVLSE